PGAHLQILRRFPSSKMRSKSSFVTASLRRVSLAECPSFGLRAKADHVAIRVFYLKLERPGMVGERRANGHAPRFQFVMEFLRVFHANPYPCAATPLSAAAKVNAGAVAIDTGEIVTTPAGVPETKFIHVKAETGVHVFNAENRLAILKADCDRAD